jgi:hypothetical protein
MYFAVMKLSFEDESAEPDQKALRSLVESLRSRFKVTAAVIEGQTSAIAVTALGSSEERLNQTLDALTEFCENAGMGRIESDATLLDHIDAISEMAEEQDDGESE